MIDGEKKKNTKYRFFELYGILIAHNIRSPAVALSSRELCNLRCWTSKGSFSSIFRVNSRRDGSLFQVAGVFFRLSGRLNWTVDAAANRHGVIQTAATAALYFFQAVKSIHRRISVFVLREWHLNIRVMITLYPSTFMLCIKNGCISEKTRPRHVSTRRRVWYFVPPHPATTTRASFTSETFSNFFLSIPLLR